MVNEVGRVREFRFQEPGFAPAHAAVYDTTGAALATGAAKLAVFFWCFLWCFLFAEVVLADLWELLAVAG